jgi:hypothetical protein
VLSEMRRRSVEQARHTVQEEGIDVGAKFGDDEWHPLRHQTTHESAVTRQRSRFDDTTGQTFRRAFAGARASYGLTIESV